VSVVVHYKKGFQRRSIIPLPVFISDPTDSQLASGDFQILALSVSANKMYYVTISVSVKVRLVLVVKTHSKPDVKDFFGGDRITLHATLLLVDFTDTNRLYYNFTKESSGLKYAVKYDNGSSLNLFGTVTSENETALLYFGLMPTVYDDKLCRQCKISSDRLCGFCSGSHEQDLDIDVTITAVRYAANCVMWNWEGNGSWGDDYCEVSDTLNACMLS